MRPVLITYYAFSGARFAYCVCLMYLSLYVSFFDSAYVDYVSLILFNTVFITLIYKDRLPCVVGVGVFLVPLAVVNVLNFGVPEQAVVLAIDCALTLPCAALFCALRGDSVTPKGDGARRL